MNILYISSTCSPKMYTECVESNGSRVSQPAQKYNLLLAEGLSDSGAKVKFISSRPVNRSKIKRLWFKSEKDTHKGIEFNYVPFINYPGFRQLFLFFGVFFKVLFSSSSRKSTTVVCDALNIASCFAAQSAAFIRRYKTLGIVTDVPCHFSYINKVTLTQKINLHIMRRFKYYLLLTEQMNEIVNPRGKPYVVLEGHADINMSERENLLENKADKKICIYAGSLMRIYGIERLVKGFVAAEAPDSELHIYGSGDYVEELEKLVSQCKNVKYMGIAPNSEVVEAELKATLLINPRPTNEDYTKYSFPSKNMEYMSSGTPVLTTRLPGMPKEYNDYVYLIDDESEEGICSVLRDILSRPREELHNKGLKAKRFVIENKNNREQAKKVLNLITTRS